MGDGGEKALRKMALKGAAVKDSPKGFAAFFEAMSGMKLHVEGARWIVNAYDAHDKGMGLLQECHREAGKTTVISKFFLAFRIGMEPHKTWAVVRINDQKARMTAKAIARIIEYDPTWKEFFPNVVPNKDSGWGDVNGYYVRDISLTDEEWEQKSTASVDDPTFIGYGWNSGSVIGSRWTGGVVVDDIIDAKIMRSDADSASVMTFVTSTLSYCLTEGAWEFWNFTPWTSTDIYANRKNTGNYMHNKSPALIPAKKGEKMTIDTGEIYGKIELEAEYWPPAPLNLAYPDYGNIPLSGNYYFRYWAEAWPWERFEKKYRDGVTDDGSGGHLEFSRMLMLDLEAIKGLNLKAEWLHLYPADEIYPSWPVYMGIDYASTQDKLKNKNRDFFALAILRAIPGGGLVLVDGYRGRISKGEALQRTAAMYGIYPTAQLIGVESIGKGEEFYNDLVMVNDAFGIPLPLFPIPHHAKGKGARFEEWLAPRLQMGRIWISDVQTPFIREFVNEWLTYPNGAFDDCLDAVYMGALAGEGLLLMGSRSGESGYQKVSDGNNPLRSICAHRLKELENRR